MPKKSALFRQFDPQQIAIPGSLQHLMLRHVEDLERRNYTPDTIKNRRVILLRFARWLEERAVTDATAITRAMVERYQRSLFHQRKADGKPLSIRTQTERVKLVQLFFAWATKRHLLPANPAADLDYPRPIKSLPEILTASEIAAILAVPATDTALGLRDRSILETFYSTGMRRMEVVNLTMHDIDHERGIVRILQGKGQKDRYIPIGDIAMHWLGRYLAEARPDLRPGLDERCIYLNANGRPISRDNLTIRMRAIMKAAGIEKPGSCHLFRHTMATHLLEAGCDVRVIQEMLGHTKLETTAIYTHVGIAHLKKAHDAFHPAGKRPETA
jgi:integrase/recombinase XerD